MLDDDIARTGHGLDVVLTWAGEWMSHVRSAPEIAKRYPDARIWAPIGSREEMLKRTTAVTDWFAPGDPLPGGIEAQGSVMPGEVVLWLPEQRALVPADVIVGDPDGGGLCLLPDSWLAEGVTPEAQRDALRPLLDLPIELVLVSHGEPVLSDGHSALASALGG
jgi:glyoxylase-like metal-dependent hydrolase (beta-lactamase superfamily II)